MFFDLLFYASSLSENSSLEHLVSYLDSEYGIKMCKQSLDERFHAKTVNFVKEVLGRLIAAQLSQFLYDKLFFSEFEHVRIKDSTKFNAPSTLAKNYKGSGGNDSVSKAGISIQYEFDLKTGKILVLIVTEAVRNDQTDASQTSGNVCENDLIIRDLGYFSTEVLKKIQEQNAFFLSRLHSTVLVYDENGKEIDFEKIYDFMAKHKLQRFEKQVFIGANKLPVRLFIALVPSEVYQERMRSKQKEEKRRGHKMKDRTKFLLHFNLFITNTDAEKLPAEKIMVLYRFRWQVELMFKNWKSLFSIHKFHKMKENRYITMLHIRLILIVVNLQIINQVQYTLSKQNINDSILSYHKALHTMKDRFSDILHILRCEINDAIKLMEKLYLILSKNHWREGRKKRENFVDNILKFYLYI